MNFPSLIVFPAGAAAILLAAACKEASSGETDPLPPPAPATSVPAVTTNDPAALPGFDPQEVRADPNLATWQSEIFSEAASSQLKLLATALADRRAFEAVNLAALVTDDFETSRLQPPGLAPVFDRGKITVWRGATADLPDHAPPAPTSLADELQALLSGLDESSRVQAEFKIVGVDFLPNRPATEVLVRLGWTSAAHRHQVNATWRCGWRTDPGGPPRLRRIEIDAADFEMVTYDSPEPLLADRTAAVLGANPSLGSQLAHGSDYWMSRIEGAYGIDLMDPQGIAVADVNGDGLDDLYLCQPGGLPNRLFLAQPDGTAIDRSAAAGLDFCDFCRHALFADFDNDGDQDLVALLNATAVFLENDGEGVFRERTRRTIPGNAYSFTAADYDQDSLLDLFIAVRDADPANRHNSLLGDPVPYHDANNGGPNVMLRNEGGFAFREVTKESGLDVNNRRFSQAAAWEDFDNDGDPDLYVANDFGRNNLYRNDDGRFTDIAAEAGVEDLSAGMSVSWADYNLDGRMDLYVGNMFSSAGNRITYQRHFKSGAGDAAVAGFRRHARGNSLFENLGDGSFRDTSVPSGVTMGRWAWASPFVDLNNDRWPDLAVANGFITNSDSGDL